MHMRLLFYICSIIPFEINTSPREWDTAGWVEQREKNTKFRVNELKLFYASASLAEFVPYYAYNTLEFWAPSFVSCVSLTSRIYVIHITNVLRCAKCIISFTRRRNITCNAS